MNQLSAEMNIKDGTFQYIHNGVDLRHLDDLCSTSYACKKTADKPTLLFGGRLFWSKGVMNLLDLAYLLEKKHHLDLNVVIYGSGPMYNRIVERKAKYGLKNVILRDFTDRSSFLREMINAKFVLLPSPHEAAPMIILESMCLGKIPVMFNLPYSREFTENGKYGLLCDNVPDMASKIKEVYNSDSISNFENKIRSFARQNYSMEKTANAYCELYKTLCK
jgi:glycosyltransferase involved in cell wall biosynthesis